jgi:hypothetical protein
MAESKLGFQFFERHARLPEESNLVRYRARQGSLWPVVLIVPDAERNKPDDGKVSLRGHAVMPAFLFFQG